MYSEMEKLRINCTLSPWTGQAGRCQECNISIAHLTKRRTWCSDKCSRLWEKNHIWNRARSSAKRKTKWQCSRPGCRAHKKTLEVNHIHPLVGAGYGPSCSHHAENLEVLCKPHHQIETNRQRDERKAEKEKSKIVAIDIPPEKVAKRSKTDKLNRTVINNEKNLSWWSQWQEKQEKVSTLLPRDLSALTAIGYWGNGKEKNLPIPTEHIVEWIPGAKEVLLSWLRQEPLTILKSKESKCLICRGDNGAWEGIYSIASATGEPNYIRWPIGLTHYVEAHNVFPPGLPEQSLWLN
jgi:hypothetical protein